MIWTDGFVSFPSAEGSSGILGICSLCGIEVILFFLTGLDCSGFSIEVCAVLQVLECSWQHQQVYHFSSPPLILPSPHCSLLCFSFHNKFSGTSGRNFLFSPLLSGYNGSPNTHFFQATTWLMSCQGRVHYSCLLLSLVVSLSTLLFFRLEAYCLI